MAEINAGQVNVGAGTYEVILRPIGTTNSKNNFAKSNDIEYANENEEPKMGGKRGNRKTRKAGKTMEGGKRKMSGYMKFAKARRGDIIKAHPEWKGDVVAVAKELGKEWKSMTDAEKAKY